MDNEENRSCIDCGVGNCNFMKGTYPPFCLTTHMEDEVMKKAMDLLMEPENNKVAVAAAEVEYEGYLKRTRVEEVIQFAAKIGAKKLGIATCLGLLSESRTLAKILRINGFEVYGVGCKAGAVSKTEIGIPEQCCEIGPNMCNPVFQAQMLNKIGTDLNLVVGLCVGHDSLFYKYSDALCTTVITKDRVLFHNPAAALYASGSYYKHLMTPQTIGPVK